VFHQKIKSFGFQTFDPWINEKYDQIENMYDRLEAIKKEIDRIAELDVNQLHKDIRHILEHNRQTYGKYINSRFICGFIFGAFIDVM
jgi:hypothetical protein